jgi:hypothetical protein
MAPTTMNRRAFVKFLGLAGVLGGVNLVSGGCDLLFSSDGCPISQIGRTLLEEAVFKIASDALFTAALSHDRERAFALSLLGVAQSYSSIMFLAGECQQPRVYDSFCSFSADPAPLDDLFWQARDACGRYTCEGNGMELLEVYLTMRPKRASQDRHEFSYPATDPAGTAIYTPNPYVKWRFDTRDPQAWIISADVSHRVKLTTAERERLDLSHSGKVRVAKVANEPATLDLELGFPALASQPVALTLRIDYPSGGTVMGSVKSGPNVLASVSGRLTGGPPRFTWVGKCRR